jgi:hypothetical protein
MTIMSHFVKLTTLTEDGNFLRSWVEQGTIKTLSQNSATQANDNNGTCEFVDGTVIQLIGFNETIESLA